MIQRIKRQIQEENALFKRNKQAIIHYNKRTLHVILVSGMVVFALLALSGFLPGNETYRRWEFLWGIAACALMLLLIHRTQVGQHVWALYAVQAIHVSYCVYSSTIIWPNYLCVTFLACLLMHSLLYLDKGWRVCLATALASILYCVCVSLAKTPALARDEFTNVACFYALGTLIGAFARRARLNMIDMEQQLRISEEQYRIVLLQSGNIMCRYNLSDKSISIPPELAEQLGIPSLISNAPYAPVRSGDISDDTADVYINFFERILAGNKTGVATFQMRLPTGWSWLKATFTTIFSDGGDPVYAVLSFIDVTEQRKKELAYEKWMQEVAAMSSEKTALFEWDLTHDMSEGGNGELYDYFKDQANETFNARTAKYAACHVYAKDRPAYLAFLNREQMLGAYHEGINHAEMDFREIRKTGGYRWMHIAVQLVPYPDTGGVKAFIIIRDIDEERRALLATQTQARQDALTGLLNRSAFHEETVALLDSKIEGALHAFLMLDIDGFKQVNDTFGHVAGDEQLAEVANTLRSLLRHDDVIGRLGGDEFFACMRNVQNRANIEFRAQALNKALHRSLSPDHEISASIGIALFPNDGETFEDLYRKADIALYEAKKSGRNCYAFYEARMDDSAYVINATPIDAEHAAR